MGDLKVPVGLDISDADAAVGDVKDPKTFYAGVTPKKTGTLPTRTLDPANETVQEGFYVATTLSAVDTDLVVANIKKDVNIFGKVGTYEPTLVAEAESGTFTAIAAVEYLIEGRKCRQTVGGNSDIDPFITKTDTFSAISKTLAVLGGVFTVDANSNIKIRLFMGGTQVAETAFLTIGPEQFSVLANRSLSGSQIIKVTIHNYNVSDMQFYWYSQTTDTTLMFPILVVGSVKI